MLNFIVNQPSKFDRLSNSIIPIGPAFVRIRQVSLSLTVSVENLLKSVISRESVRTKISGWTSQTSREYHISYHDSSGFFLGFTSDVRFHQTQDVQEYL